VSEGKEAPSEGKDAPWSAIFGFFLPSLDNIFLKKDTSIFLFWHGIYELSTEVSVHLDFWMSQVLHQYKNM
jgi:hypothetical protein